MDAEGLPVDDRMDEAVVDGASVCQTSHGTCLRIDTRFAADRSHGRMRVADCRVTVDARLDVLAGRPLTTGARGQRVVYVDLETTGLSGGAGTVPFLVGVGEWTDEGFVTVQFLLPGYAAERSMLEAVNLYLAGVAVLVTFNGRTFDVPVMEMRGEFHRIPQDVCALPHLDMLPAARRLWRIGDEGERSCRLTHLEESVLGFGRVGDVPGFEIPGRYFAFVRGGGGHLLAPVLLHNRLDLMSLAALTARAQGLLETGRDEPPCTAEAWGLGTLFERDGQADAALRCYRQVIGDRYQSIEARRTAGRALARLLRRQRRFDEAAVAWRELLRLGGHPLQMREAREALAIHHEHRVRDLSEARRWAEAGATHAIGSVERAAFDRRIDRIARKAAAGVTPEPPLWAGVAGTPGDNEA